MRMRYYREVLVLFVKVLGNKLRLLVLRSSSFRKFQRRDRSIPPPIFSSIVLDKLWRAFRWHRRDPQCFVDISNFIPIQVQ